MDSTDHQFDRGHQKPYPSVVERAIPVLPVDDLAQARRFYVDILGFREVFRAHYPHQPEEGTILGVERGGLRIHLDCPMPGHGRNACAVLEVEDADALHKEWHERVGTDSAPQTQTWGSRTFDLVDPFGNTLFVIGPSK